MVAVLAVKCNANGGSNTTMCYAATTYTNWFLSLGGTRAIVARVRSANEETLQQVMTSMSILRTPPVSPKQSRSI